jgi:hypothetical protein
VDEAVAERRASSLESLRALLLEQGGLMASLVGPALVGGDVEGAQGDGQAGGGHVDGAGADGGHRDGAAQGPAQLACAGPRAEGRRSPYELLVEAIYEGYLLHYGAPRVVQPPEADLGVLAGDRLYALGLDRLVKLGDMQAVAELADVITLTALAHGEGDDELADAVWWAGAYAVGWGPSAEHERAKTLVRAGEPQALGALRSLVV